MGRVSAVISGMRNGRRVEARLDWDFMIGTSHEVMLTGIKTSLCVEQ